MSIDNTLLNLLAAAVNNESGAAEILGDYIKDELGQEELGEKLSLRLNLSRIHDVLAQQEQVAIIWHVEDVLDVRPDLSRKDALLVLRKSIDNYDCNLDSHFRNTATYFIGHDPIDEEDQVMKQQIREWAQGLPPAHHQEPEEQDPPSPK